MEQLASHRIKIGTPVPMNLSSDTGTHGGEWNNSTEYHVLIHIISREGGDRAVGGRPIRPRSRWILSTIASGCRHNYHSWMEFPNWHPRRPQGGSLCQAHCHGLVERKVLRRRTRKGEPHTPHGRDQGLSWPEWAPSRPRRRSSSAATVGCGACSPLVCPRSSQPPCPKTSCPRFYR